MMRRLIHWYMGLSHKKWDSVMITVGVWGTISTVLSILGLSLGDIKYLNIWGRIGVLGILGLGIYIGIYYSLGKCYDKSIETTIHDIPVNILYGDIFSIEGWKVIACDSHFDTRVDDKVISKRSLHGQLVLDHGDEADIKKAVEAEASRLSKQNPVQKNAEGLYEFPLGTVIRYDSNRDGNTYLMLAMTRLNDRYEAHTNMVEYEQTLMKMWLEISRVYASHDIIMPVLGSGISRFDDGSRGIDPRLRCMLCTLKASGISLNSKVTIVLHGSHKDLSLYEYKNIFRTF